MSKHFYHVLKLFYHITFNNTNMLTNLRPIATIIFAGNVSRNVWKQNPAMGVYLGEVYMTIKDIAKLSGVAVSTVSRVINNHPDVSSEAREKVLRVIAEYNFVPNNSARDLVKTKSDAIGLIVRGSQNTFYTDIIHAIEFTLDKAGYTMVMRQIGSNDDEITCGAMMQREKRLLGIIFLGGRSDYSPGELNVITVPYVFCTYNNCYGTLPADSYSSVSISDEDEAMKAVEKLISHGHKKIAALVSATDDRSISQLRYQGYVAALKKHGIEVSDDLVIRCGSFNIKDAYLATKAKLLKKQSFTAVFAIADNMAIGAMKALREAGLTIPDDCSIIGIDGIEVSEYVDPVLSTLCQPMAEMGTKSAEQIIGLIEETGTNSQILLHTTFREGASIK